MRAHWISSVHVAFTALKTNRVRSALTMLGIVIGVAAVIATVAVGTGASRRVQSQIASIGSNMVIVIPGSLTSSGLQLGTGSATTLTRSDARELSAQCPDISDAAPAVRGAASVVYEGSNWGTTVLGTTPEYLKIRDISVAKGEPFNQQDIEKASKVALLGPTVVQKLYGSADPVGTIIRIKQVPFVVQGVLTPKGQSAGGQDQDDIVLLPITSTKQKVLGFKSANADAVDAILMQAVASDRIDAAQEEARSLLRQRHHLLPNEDDDFSMRNLEEIFKAQATSSRVMSLMLAAVASVSLIVGGIGIMNIMLVSVRERTKEIGLRQAVGAKTRDILTQFLVEATTLSICGGVVGIVIGIVSSIVISRVAGWQTVVSPSAIVLAVTFSALVGIGFGFYPARKAAYLDPIEALRFE
ncbi:ABC transporter permease [Edaphobacter sp. 12200R-103]|uniref:ABC transporter permease n=1 Tax=Edaphobacter sp. 12200R-103 TaxID=2703788 RepID=UPI00138B40D2|nr:ABC transporter permease [Edaphobacter sp. 12200R-103]QHS50978.1 FtsX-like permease family protein [Edaphobacter sp. 12200R-103]